MHCRPRLTRHQEALARLVKLEEMGRLTGVMDDRGKYIYISEEVCRPIDRRSSVAHVTLQEMKSFAKYVRQQGRISLADLTRHSSRLIRLSE